MTVLSHDARTILRSRVRRHAQSSAFIPAGGKVSTMTNAQLIDVGHKLGLTVPNDAECDAFRAAKAAGGDGCAVADQVAVASSLGGPGMAQVLIQPVAVPGVTAASTDADDEDMTVPEDDGSTVDGSAMTDPDAEARAKAEAEFAAITALMGKGDFAGYKQRIMEMVQEANRPAAAPPRIQYVHTGPVPEGSSALLRDKPLSETNVPVVGKLDAGKIILPLYDAADAPVMDPDYVWPEMSGEAFAAFMDLGHVFLHGPAGTGKTTFAEQVAAHFGRQFIRVSCDDQTEAATLCGMTVPDGAGGVKWQDGQLAQAIRKPGAVVLIDEPTVARAGALYVLQAVLDKRKLHIQETGEVIHVAPDVIFIAADNTNGTGDTTGQYEGTRILSRALLDRFDIHVPVSYLPVDKEARALMARTGCSKKLALDVCKFANFTRIKSESGDLSHGLGFRRLMALTRQIQRGVEPVRAFQLAVIETAPHDDKEALRQMWAAESKVTA